MVNIQGKEGFRRYVEGIKSRDDFQLPYAFGLGVRRVPNQNREVTLDTWFPHTNLSGNASGTYAVLYDCLNNNQIEELWNKGYVALNQEQLERAYSKFAPFKGEAGHPNIKALEALKSFNSIQRQTEESVGNKYHRKDVVLSIVPEKKGEALSAEDAYLRLHLLSHRHVKPNEIGLGVFGKMNNNAWIQGFGPVQPEDVEELRYNLLSRGNVMGEVTHQDKFPFLTNCVALDPSIRMADSKSARLGANIGNGTVMMRAAYTNFNAGTEGPNMIEGRISAGVYVGKNTDIGGGASTMGTLSGGGKEVITIGENCLIGANGGLGISLGNYCAIEAGLYVTAGQKIRVQRVDEGSLTDRLGEFSNLQSEQVVKGIELSGIPYTTFIRDSQNGGIVAQVGKPNGVRLNDLLHN